MSPLDAPKAAHHTRMQLSSIKCERELTKEEAILHNVATRFMVRILTECEKRLETQNEDTSGFPNTGEEEGPPGEEPGLLSGN
jgi:hypothetical protein